MTPLEQAVKIVDELVCLFRLYEQDYHVVDDALALIAQTASDHDSFPVTAGLIPILQARGFLAYEPR